MMVTDGDFEDSGTEYLPSPVLSSCNDGSEEVQHSRTSSVTTLQLTLPSTSSSITAEAEISRSAADTTDETPILKRRKRVKRPETWRRNILKLKGAKVEQYENRKKTIFPAKTPKTGECPCSKKCHLKINEERQLEIF